MAVPTIDAVSLVACDDCPGRRVIVAEACEAGTRVVVLDGCAVCAGAHLTLANVR